jgi:hypothetical protein
MKEKDRTGMRNEKVIWISHRDVRGRSYEREGGMREGEVCMREGEVCMREGEVGMIEGERRSMDVRIWQGGG